MFCARDASRTWKRRTEVARDGVENHPTNAERGMLLRCFHNFPGLHLFYPLKIVCLRLHVCLMGYLVEFLW